MFAITLTRGVRRRSLAISGLLTLVVLLLWPAAAEARTCPHGCPGTTTTTTAPEPPPTIPTTTTTTPPATTTTTTTPSTTTTSLPATTTPPTTGPPTLGGTPAPSTTSSTAAETTTTTAAGPPAISGPPSPAAAVPALNARATPRVAAPEKSTSPTVPPEFALAQAFVPARGLALGDLLLLTAGALAGFWLIFTEVVESGTRQGRLARLQRRGGDGPLARVLAWAGRPGQRK